MNLCQIKEATCSANVYAEKFIQFIKDTKEKNAIAKFLKL